MTTSSRTHAHDTHAHDVPAAFSRRAFLAAGGATVSAVALAGCSGKGSQADSGTAAPSTDPSRQVTVAMSPSNEPAAGFNPCINWGCGEHVHEPLIQSTLIVTDEDMSFQNDLATSYACSTDGLTWTFVIRDDARFTDGEPVRASDVAFTVNTIVATPNAEADLSQVSEAVATDDTTVELHLTKPCNTLLYTLAVMGIVPEHAYGDDYGSNPVGSGRYRLAQWDKGQQVILEANPDYYGDAPSIERVVVVFMEEDAARAAVMAGQVDMAYTSPVTVGASAGSGDGGLSATDGSAYELAAYDTVDSRGISLPVVATGATREDGGTTYEAGNDVTCNLEVRRAINYGVDRQSIVDDVLEGFGTCAYSIGDGMPWASEDMRCELDADRARRLLEDAGWTRGTDGGIYERDGLRCAFDLWYAAGDTTRQAMAQAFANQMAGVGIEVNLREGTWDEIYQRQYADPVMWGWGSNSPADVYELSHSGGTMNYACYEDATTDEYLDAALAAANVEESYPLWQRSEWDGTDGIAPEGAATWVWLANVQHLYWKRASLKVAAQKLQPHGHGWSVLNNVDRWSWA